MLLDVRGISAFTDYMVIMSADNRRQLAALVTELERVVHAAGLRLHHIEGTAESGWVLLDFSDVIVHVFSEEQRAYYRLEQVWREAKDPSSRFRNPAFRFPIVAQYLAVREEDAEFALGRFDRVRAVDEVAADVLREVAPDGAGRRFPRVRCPHRVPDHAHGLRPLDSHGQDRPRGHELRESHEERPLDMLGVVPSCNLHVHTHELEPDDLQAPVLESCDDSASETALDCVGLQQDKRSFSQQKPQSMAGYAGASS